MKILYQGSHLVCLWFERVYWFLSARWNGLFLVENRASSDTFNGSTRNSRLLGPGRAWHHPAACREGKAGAPLGREHVLFDNGGPFVGCQKPQMLICKRKNCRAWEGQIEWIHIIVILLFLVLTWSHRKSSLICITQDYFHVPFPCLPSGHKDLLMTSVTSHYLTATLGHFPRFLLVSAEL